MSLLDLPLELIVQILLELAPPDLLACVLTTKYLHTIVRDSIVLQYNAALLVSKATDNPCSTLSTAAKLEALRAAEDAWALVRPGFTQSIEALHNQCGVYDLTGGVYLLSNAARNAVHYLRLPTLEGEDVKWQEIISERSIIDIGLCLYEHDLLALVTTTPHQGNDGSRMTYDIELEFIEFSTGKPHPQARDHRIHVTNSEWEKPSIGIEIVGDNLVLILSYNTFRQLEDRIFIYEWQANILKMSFLRPPHTYSGLLFLTEDIILMPNTRSNTLDIFHIPTKPTLASSTPILVLQLPQLANEGQLGGISCRAEPNPIGATSRTRSNQANNQKATSDGSQPKRGFLASAKDAICIFDLRIHLPHVVFVQGIGLQTEWQFRHRFTFVVHRNALIDLVMRYGQNDVVEGPFSPSFVYDAVRGAASERWRDTPLAASFERSLLLYYNTSTSPTGPPTLPHATWAPRITRWFNSDDGPAQWITTSAGQRFVRMGPNRGGVGVRLEVLDFNTGGGLGARVRRRAMEEKQDRLRRVWAMAERQAHNENPMVKLDDDDGSDRAQRSNLASISTDADYEEDAGDDPEHDQYIYDIDAVATDADADEWVDEEDDEDENDDYEVEEHGGEGHQMNVYDDDDSSGADSPEPQFVSSLSSPLSSLVSPYTPSCLVSSSSQVKPASLFAEPVSSALPYRISSPKTRYHFDGVMLDEERVIGLTTNEIGNICRVEVLHFG